MVGDKQTVLGWGGSPGIEQCDYDGSMGWGS